MPTDLLTALGLRSFASGWPQAIGLTCAAAAIIVAASWWTGRLRIVMQEQLADPRRAAFWLLLMALYPTWAMVQQGFLFLVLALVRQGLPPDWLVWAPVLTALLFAALHLPNFHLMFAVGFMVMIFTVHMDQHHNLAAVAMAHGVLAPLWRLLSPPAIGTTLNIWHWYARNQRTIDARLDGEELEARPWGPLARLMGNWGEKS